MSPSTRYAYTLWSTRSPTEGNSVLSVGRLCWMKLNAEPAMCPLLFMIKSARTCRRWAPVRCAPTTYLHAAPFQILPLVLPCPARGLLVYAKHNAACVHTCPSLNHATTLALPTPTPHSHLHSLPGTHTVADGQAQTPFCKSRRISWQL